MTKSPQAAYRSPVLPGHSWCTLCQPVAVAGRRRSPCVGWAIPVASIARVYGLTTVFRKSTVRRYLTSAMDGDTEKKNGQPTWQERTVRVATLGFEPMYRPVSSRSA